MANTIATFQPKCAFAFSWEQMFGIGLCSSCVCAGQRAIPVSSLNVANAVKKRKKKTH